MPMLSVGVENDAPIDLHYQDRGEGAPVVLIHGWPLNERSWEPQIVALLDAGHRVVTYDRRGFGSSSQPESGYDYDTFAADLSVLLETLDLRDVTLVGFSMGGGEVVRYLAKYGSDRIAKAVLAGAVPPYLYKSEDNPDGGLDDETIAGFENGVEEDRNAFLDGFATNFFSANGELKVSEEDRQYAVDMAAEASTPAILGCIEAFARTDFREDMPKIDVPTLVIHGDADAIVPFEVSGKRSHEAIANSTLVLVEGGPHGFNTSHPDRFNQELLAFLG
ncbi:MULTISPECIES: alpha/beta fold hydrolase [unclassified Rhodococcus (in: high G+C Gram-positive bacteria)]|jgi:pimeloyl-ACP methyl ester carboxylesterase|uniref:alpha/beta fold hydrolase n=1 Tax=unclassified Rhodococcus (in: high G+C Gram-positive bacteria) TaxID=192944 RepID=UPI0006FA70CA|nr:MULTISPECIES: alpha/beta hydrolase [unclassified Rhodococcus (in: high G+C Gram-positive bacteria)]KQU35904.1 bromoperoxidase [Rhodococcus sp. Leaf225]KQU48451.1 bromoperoxidase [Rhodococcus sp. Leaf258]MBY6677343.1 alpha/beta hydrolase [Rhodococcus sp. BP-332]MDQ1182579.1 non-heme chloroperoxidase [Rhodococcus sp. SORGH_AS_0301]MDQ1199652.1 non-heme chloroperoxidase [Rhodococcus sp. SORGH_AS_0303]